jgi:hypothetical protein
MPCARQERTGAGVQNCAREDGAGSRLASANPVRDFPNLSEGRDGRGVAKRGAWGTNRTTAAREAPPGDRDRIIKARSLLESGRGEPLGYQ